MAEKPFDFEGDYGSHYDTFIRQVIPGYESLHALAGALLEPGCGDCGRVLVAGCGSGSEIGILGERHPGWSFVGVDPSEGMIAITRRLVHSRGLEGRVSLVTGTPAELPPTQAYNGATCMLVSHFLDGDQPKVDLFREIGRRLAPGGRLVVADACEENSDSFRAMMQCRWNYARRQGADADRYRKFQDDCRNALKPADPAHELDLIRRAGFATVRPFWMSLHIHAWLAWEFSG